MRPTGGVRKRTLERWGSYAREEIPAFFGEVFSDAIWNVGFVVRPTREPKNVFLLVTLEKDQMVENFQYTDHFLSPDVFQWESQNQTTQESQRGRVLKEHAERGVAVHLFVRIEKKTSSNSAAPFIYCGPVTFESWEGEKPITVRWLLGEPVPERLWNALKVR